MQLLDQERTLNEYVKFGFMCCNESLIKSVVAKLASLGSAVVLMDEELLGIIVNSDILHHIAPTPFYTTLANFVITKYFDVYLH